MASDFDAHQPKSFNGLGLAGLIIGIVGGIVGLIPCIGGFVGIPLAALGLLLAGIGLIIALVGKRMGIGLAIAGTVVSFLALIVATAMLVVSWGAGVAVASAAAEQEAKFSSMDKAVREKEVETVRATKGIAVTAESLRREFVTNDLQANSKYRGQVIEATGIVSHADPSFDLPKRTLLYMRTGTEGDFVICHFEPAQAEEAKRLRMDGEATIRGKFRRESNRDVELYWCEVVKK